MEDAGINQEKMQLLPLVNGKQLNVRYSVYLEHLIQVRDLLAFAAEETTDVNLFINQTKRMELRVSCVHAKAW